VLSPETKERLWYEALAYAGLLPDSVHRFDGMQGDLSDDQGLFLPPCEAFVENAHRGIRLSPQDEDLANLFPDNPRRPGIRHMRRVVIAPIQGLAPLDAKAVFAGLARHELEHVRQWNVCGDIPLGIGALARKFRAYLEVDIAAMPTELDANAAAFALLAAEKRDSIERIGDHPTYGLLVRTRTQPEPFDTLAERMRDFVRPLRAAVEAVGKRPGLTTERYLAEAFRLDRDALGWN
jgi:hypothetical protein